MADNTSSVSSLIAKLAENEDLKEKVIENESKYGEMLSELQELKNPSQAQSTESLIKTDKNHWLRLRKNKKT